MGRLYRTHTPAPKAEKKAIFESINLPGLAPPGSKRTRLPSVSCIVKVLEPTCSRCLARPGWAFVWVGWSVRAQHSLSSSRQRNPAERPFRLAQPWQGCVCARGGGVPMRGGLCGVSALMTVCQQELCSKALSRQFRCHGTAGCKPSDHIILFCVYLNNTASPSATPVY